MLTAFKRRRALLFGAILSVGLIAICAPAWSASVSGGTPLPGVTVSGNLGESVPSLQSVSLSVPSTIAIGSNSLTVAYSPGDLTMYAQGGYTAQVTASGSFAFVVNAPSGATGPVPLIFRASGTTSATGVAEFVNENVQLSTPTTAFPYPVLPFYTAGACSITPDVYQGYTCGPPSSFNLTGASAYHFTLMAGTLGFESFYLSAADVPNPGVGVSAGTGTFSASIDPMIEIDPTFLASHPGYSLEFSPPVGGTTSTTTPEPADLSILGIGLFALVGVWLKKP